MRLFLVILLAFQFGCERPMGPLEDGYYISSLDHKQLFFCKKYFWHGGHIIGQSCKDMTCTFSFDPRVTFRVISLESGVINETKRFNTLFNFCERK